ncbi:MAG: ATP-dependent sacrificial sulfur transferase LarE [Clostridia bacterium]|nr:ATP-dependent sacrificial sulfur transferase LarE [Clostridia bacterium]
MKLKEFFSEHKRVAIAFSGGTDSAYLLYEALLHAEEVKAYYADSAFQPAFEKKDALRMAEKLGAQIKVLPVDVLSDKEIASNPPNRCYFCKRAIFGVITEEAAKDGFDVVIDGTNASDDINDRPGFRALSELSVLSPLRICGLEKDEIRRLSHEAGLFTWDKPAYACLATRIPATEEITARKLQETEAAEGFLFSLGFRDFRVRRAGDAAKLQVAQGQMGKVIENRGKIVSELKKYYSDVMLDLEERK